MLQNDKTSNVIGSGFGSSKELDFIIVSDNFSFLRYGKCAFSKQCDILSINSCLNAVFYEQLIQMFGFSLVNLISITNKTYTKTICQFTYKHS